MARIIVLAGTNGAGKSSIAGAMLRHRGAEYYNPDEATRRILTANPGMDEANANSLAWQEGVRQLETAIATPQDYAFETTLGGNTVPRRILDATRSHDVLVWFCGLSSPQQHLARIRARVACGGHDIPEAKVRERWTAARENLIALMPHLARLQVHDNSAEVAPGEPIPDPPLVLEMREGRCAWPVDLASLGQTPDWAKPLVEAALSPGS
jgi:predicted ABC-type ATPase